MIRRDWLVALKMTFVPFRVCGVGALHTAFVFVGGLFDVDRRANEHFVIGLCDVVVLNVLKWSIKKQWKTIHFTINE